MSCPNCKQSKNGGWFKILIGAIILLIALITSIFPQQDQHHGNTRMQNQRMGNCEK